MDVRFCEGRNPCREAHVRAVSFRTVVCALSRTRQEKCAFHLTKTYMEVGYAWKCQLVSTPEKPACGKCAGLLKV